MSRWITKALEVAIVLLAASMMAEHIGRCNRAEAPFKPTALELEDIRQAGDAWTEPLAIRLPLGTGEPMEYVLRPDANLEPKVLLAYCGDTCTEVPRYLFTFDAESTLIVYDRAGKERLKVLSVGGEELMVTNTLRVCVCAPCEGSR